jgi:hypothetical protein
MLSRVAGRRAAILGDGADGHVAPEAGLPAGLRQLWNVTTQKKKSGQCTSLSGRPAQMWYNGTLRRQCDPLLVSTTFKDRILREIKITMRSFAGIRRRPEAAGALVAAAWALRQCSSTSGF